MTLAAVVIVSEKRRDLLARVVASIAQCDERVVVGDFAPSLAPPGDYKYYCVPPVTRTTIDALMKRDVGWLVTGSDAVVFLCDDHVLEKDFAEQYRRHWSTRSDWDFLAPWRFTVRDNERIPLNNGLDQYGEYIGGHGGVFRRICAKTLPWLAGPHNLHWDLWHAQELKKLGLILKRAGPELAIEDIEPGAEPWR